MTCRIFPTVNRKGTQTLHKDSEPTKQKLSVTFGLTFFKRIWRGGGVQYVGVEYDNEVYVIRQPFLVPLKFL